MKNSWQLLSEWKLQYMDWIQNLKVGFSNAGFLVSSVSPVKTFCESPGYSRYSFSPVSLQHQTCGLAELRESEWPKIPSELPCLWVNLKAGYPSGSKNIINTSLPLLSLSFECYGLLKYLLPITFNFCISQVILDMMKWAEACST